MCLSSDNSDVNDHSSVSSLPAGMQDNESDKGQVKGYGCSCQYSDFSNTVRFCKIDVYSCLLFPCL